MPIKYAARGISTQFRTPSELVTEDGVTLKPVDGGEVFVYSNGLEADEGIYLGSEYNAETGGFKIEDIGDEWADTETANEYGYYVLSDVVPAWYVGSSVPASVPVKSNVGVADVYKSDELIGYLNQNGSMSSVSVQGGTTVPIYINGVQVSADSTKTYTLIDAYRNGAWVGYAYSTYQLVVSNGLLFFKFNGSSGSATSLGAVKYTVS